MCKNFHFSIHIPGQLILKEYNQVILPRKKSGHLLFLVWVLVGFCCCCCCCCCLFENIELNCDYWTKVIPQVSQSSHSIFFSEGLKYPVFGLLFLFCFVKYLNMLKISTNFQQYRKVTIWKISPRIQYHNSWNINSRNVGEKMYSFLLYFYTKISTKREKNSIITHRQYIHISLRATSGSEDTTTCSPA